MAPIKLTESEKRTAAVVILFILAALIIYFFIVPSSLLKQASLSNPTPSTAAASATLVPSGKLSPKPTIRPTPSPTATPKASPKATPQASPVPPAECATQCDQNKDCGQGDNLVCYPPGPAMNKTCRNVSCPSEPNCVCP